MNRRIKEDDNIREHNVTYENNDISHYSESRNISPDSVEKATEFGKIHDREQQYLRKKMRKEDDNIREPKIPNENNDISYYSIGRNTSLDKVEKSTKSEQNKHTGKKKIMPGVMRGGKEDDNTEESTEQTMNNDISCFIIGTETSHDIVEKQTETRNGEMRGGNEDDNTEEPIEQTMNNDISCFIIGTETSHDVSKQF